MNFPTMETDIAELGRIDAEDEVLPLPWLVGETSKASEWDTVGNYLACIGSRPVCCRNEEAILATRVCQSRRRLCVCLLSCNEVLDDIIIQLKRVEQGQARLDQYLDLAVTELSEKRRLRAKLAPTLDELWVLRAANREDFRIAAESKKLISNGAFNTAAVPSAADSARSEAWRRIVLRRRQCAELVLDLKYRVERILAYRGVVEETSRKMSALQTIIRLESAECPANSDVATLKRELHRLMLKSLDSPATRARRLSLIGGHGATYSSLRQEFANRNLKFVVSVAKKYRNRGLQLFDLIQEGNVGLMHAIDKYNPKLGYRFTTYANWWILHYLKAALARIIAPVHVPYTNHSAVRRIRLATAELTQELGREPYEEEVAERVGLARGTMRQLARIMRVTYSLDRSQIGNEETQSIDLEDTREIVCSHRQHAIQQYLLEAMCLLRSRERSVIERRFGLSDGISHTLNEIAQEFSVSREYIRQIECRALEKMRNSTVSDVLRELLE